MQQRVGHIGGPLVAVIYIVIIVVFVIHKFSKFSHASKFQAPLRSNFYVLPGQLAPKIPVCFVSRVVMGQKKVVFVDICSFLKDSGHTVLKIRRPTMGM